MRHSQFYVFFDEMENDRVISPALDDLNALQRAPAWTKPVLEAALRGGPAC
jgi:hypothetical protein